MLAGCLPPPEGRAPEPPGREALRYVPVYAPRARAVRPPKTGEKRGDFKWAAGARTLGEAEAAWREYLQTHYPAGGDLEDAPDIYRRNSALYELMRLHYLLGRREEGDLIMRRLDPLDLLPDPPQKKPPRPDSRTWRLDNGATRNTP